jgi:hypothetical protein
MEQLRRLTLLQCFNSMPTRRDVLHGLAGTAVGLASLPTPDTGEARKKRKHKRKKPKLRRNEFGCVNVGGHCLGNSANCCSGICEGQKPKQGKKDSSVCVAHDTADICFPDNDTCVLGGGVLCNLDVENCVCLLTTGNAGFCGDFSGGHDEKCRVCAKDSDCQPEFGPGAACVVFGGFCSAACADTGRTACIRPCPAAAP